MTSTSEKIYQTLSWILTQIWVWIKTNPDQKTNSVITRNALNGNTKNQMKDLIGRCEYCNTNKSNELLEVHHITRVADGGRNIPENLIVMCLDHHQQAHFANNILSAQTLRYSISKRSELESNTIRQILKDADTDPYEYNKRKLREKINQFEKSPFKNHPMNTRSIEEKFNRSPFGNAQKFEDRFSHSPFGNSQIFEKKLNRKFKPPF